MRPAVAAEPKEEDVSEALGRRWSAVQTREPFQFGYATTSIEQAIDVFARTYDAGDFLVREPATVAPSSPSGAFKLRLQLAFAYVGGVTVELVQPFDDERRIFTSILPESGFGLRLHHIGYLLRTDPWSWESFRGAVPDEELLFEGAVDDHTRFAYIDTRDRLGHFQEFLWWSDERVKWLDTIPRN